MAQSQYMTFWRVAVPGRKTPIVEVRAKSSGARLGSIRWFGRWRQFCFYPELGIVTIFSKGCMNDINKQINELQAERAAQRAEDAATKAGIKSPRGVTFHG